MPPAAPAVWLRVFGISAIGWVLLALVRAAIRIAAIPRPFEIALAIFGQSLLASLPWLLLAPVVVALAAQLPWRRERRARTGALLVALGGFFIWVEGLWGWTMLPLAGYPVPRSLGVWHLIRLDQAVFTYLALLALGVAIRHHRRLEEAELRAVRLETQLTRARMHVLALQLHPHFLFNTLNAVCELVHRDAAAARDVLRNLRDLLLRSLDGNAAQEVTLEEELTLLEPYSWIQRARFPDSLSIQVDAAPGTLRALVPKLMLQPLVENAIRHGTARRGTPGTIVVRSRTEAEWLTIEVEDDGAGLRPGVRHEGLGLGITRARLNQLYGPSARLTLSPASSGGTVARLECPRRYASTGMAVDASPAEDAAAEEGEAGEIFPSSRGLVWALAAAALAVALGGAGADHVAGMWAGSPEPLGGAVIARLTEVALWFALGPATVWIAHHLARAGLRWPALVAAHLGAGLVVITLHVGLVHVLAYSVAERNLRALLLVNDLCVYAAVAVAAHAWTVRRAAAARRAATARLDGELAAARLDVLRWRLRPELLVQALDRIGELAPAEPDRADDLTARLGELLRLILQSAGSQLVPLEREADLVAAYLEVEGEIQSAPACLTLSFDARSRSTPVPPMLLQSLVEMLGGTRVAIAATHGGGLLDLVIRSRVAVPDRVHQGLPELRDRLEQHYRRSYRLTARWSGDDCTVTLRMPADPSAARAVA